MDEIIERLKKLKEYNLYRKEIILDEVMGNTGKINGKNIVIFNSNDYLNLETNKKSGYSLGTGGSRLINGTRESHKSLEKMLSNFFNIEDLEEKIKKEKCKFGLIVTEGVFSMKGDICRINEIVKISKKYGLLLMVDDAHGIGVIGRRGILDIIDNMDDIHIYMGSLSKSIGRIGGFVSAKNELVDFLRNKSRSYIYSTSLPDYECKKIKENLLKLTEELVQELQENIKYFNLKLKEKNIETRSESAIIPIFIGDEKKAIDIQKHLIDKGIFLTAIRYPTVKKGEAILRVSIMRKHTKEDIDKLFLEL